MTKGKRRQYTTEQKSKIIKRMMPPNNESVVIISREERIPEATLYKWRKDARIAGSPTPGNGQTSDKWSNQDKFLALKKKNMSTYHQLKSFQNLQIKVRILPQNQHFIVYYVRKKCRITVGVAKDRNEEFQKAI
ncbi:MAG: transposase [Amphibacillus sp.]|nr:transposase [Amphibacillus sp.]